MPAFGVFTIFAILVSQMLLAAAGKTECETCSSDKKKKEENCDKDLRCVKIDKHKTKVEPDKQKCVCLSDKAPKNGLIEAKDFGKDKRPKCEKEIEGTANDRIIGFGLCQ